MIYWLRLFGLIFAVICGIAIVGALLPRSYDFQVTQTIAADPEAIYQEIDTLPKWQSWSQWSLDNDNIESLDYGDDGLSQTWTDQRGKGSLWITKRQENQSINYSMTFANFSEMKSTIELQPLQDGATKVTWASTGELPGGPFYGYFGAFFSTGMKSLYLHGLSKIAEQVSLDQ